MKIGLDLRFLGDNIYSRFVSTLVENIIKNSPDNKFIIYANSNLNLLKTENSIVKKVDIKVGSLAEQVKFKKILKEDNNGLMIFFNHYKPIFYKKDYIILVGDLKDLYYSNFSSSFEKAKFLYLLSKNIKNAYKIICLDKITKNELIERFNVKETEINIIDGFFPKRPGYDYDYELEEVSASLATKYDLKNKYFVFSAGDSIEKNYEKLIKVFKRLKENKFEIDLVFLGTNIGKNINLRNIILESNLQENVHFLGSPKLSEKKIIYQESLGVIFPSLYEPFPFRLTEPLYFDVPILSSNLKKIESIFGDKIKYFSPISVNSIYTEVEKFSKRPVKNVDYSEIKEKYTVENTTNQILKIID
ncbi:hypothetical protein BLD25_04470 [Candidatus Gracilibacteria bacterium GN02-872]|nr:hypothetical protein BLD25_04470 [Candidatus Gracilibacteria bacterium GN02-872]